MNDTEYKYDVLLKGGHVIDPSNNIDETMDVAIKGNKIAQVAEDIPSSQARKIIDVAGLYVTPGLIDIHVHLYGYAGWL
ncbi:MAG: amidohydrolase/deacetylase family metallohydrolase, partial [bacterium]